MGCGAMTRFIEGESPTGLQQLLNILAGGLCRAPMRVTTQEDLIAVENEGLRSRDLPIRPRSSRVLRPLLGPSHPGSPPALVVRGCKGKRVPRRLAALALASRRGSRAIEAMKACRVPDPAVLRPKAPKSPPPVKVPAWALRAVAGLASER